MEHRDQIEAIVAEAMRDGDGGAQWGRAALADAWTRVRRQLRDLRDTATTLAEDERTALQLLQRFQAAPPGGGI
jgi:hypothetical protein